MLRARDEIRDYALYDYIIANRDFDRALSELKAIIIADRCRTKNIDPSWIGELLQQSEGPA